MSTFRNFWINPCR